MSYKIRETVRVRDGFIDEETGFDMSGWQGTVKEIYADVGTALVAFDSITIHAMPAAYIDRCEDEGYGWTEYGFEFAWLELAEARGKASDVEDAIAKRTSEHPYSHLGEEGRDMNKVLAGVDLDDEIEVLEAWNTYLDEHLTFPVDAEVAESYGRSPLHVGDKVRILGIEDLDDHYGLIAKLKRGRETLYSPLCDLKVRDPASPNHDPLQLYVVWFANR